MGNRIENRNGNRNRNENVNADENEDSLKTGNNFAIISYRYSTKRRVTNTIKVGWRRDKRYQRVALFLFCFFFWSFFCVANYVLNTFSIRLLFTFTEVSIKLIVLMAITSLSRPSFQFTGIIRRFPLSRGWLYIFLLSDSLSLSLFLSLSI